MLPPPPSYGSRVLSRLEQAEWHEIDPHFRDDYRIAWITVLHASRGWPIPHVTATYTVLGLHPERVWPAILERRRALLGEVYTEGISEGRRSPAHSKPSQDLPPKKPARSERSASPVTEGSDRAA